MNNIKQSAGYVLMQILCIGFAWESYAVIAYIKHSFFGYSGDFEPILGLAILLAINLLAGCLLFLLFIFFKNLPVKLSLILSSAFLLINLILPVIFSLTAWNSMSEIALLVGAEITMLVYSIIRYRKQKIIP